MTPERRQKLIKRAQRVLLLGGGVLLVLLVVTELVARFGYGLCDPPLLVADPEMEYLFAPSQHSRMFGHDIDFNQYSMRAPEFPKTKSTPDEFRVMVIGDSVVYAGTKVDQRELATTRLRESLSKRLKHPVVVGNIAAGSWGPQNMLAYTRRHGFFDADVVVIVISSHDYADRMLFDTVLGADPDFPIRKPRLALWEIATRYLPRFIAIKRQAANLGPPAPTTAPVQDVETCMTALRELIENAKKAGARVIVAQHWEQPELDGAFMPGHDVILHTVEPTGAEIVQLGPAFKVSRDRGEQPYRDFIHPSPQGQGVLAGVLEDAIIKPNMNAKPATQPATNRF